MSSHATDQARVIPLRPVAAAAAPAPDGAASPPARTGEPREPLWRDLVGDVLRRERLAQKRALKDVAEAARISMPYLSELERGRKEASSEVLAAAARALGLGLADLLALSHGELTRLGGRHTRRAHPHQTRIGPAPLGQERPGLPGQPGRPGARGTGRGGPGSYEARLLAA
ncbi:helix-turn-helix domain-containing protein [Streptomyces sp. NPDC059922]|uniref:helix-turn-helix domain-containing protein n=1 Tax=Streptomyces sp. NPDC059922 TaxID=3347005 RepID=UPI003664F1ED